MGITYKKAGVDISEIKISLNRVTFLFFIFFSLIFVSSTKIIYLSIKISIELNFKVVSEKLNNRISLLK